MRFALAVLVAAAAQLAVYLQLGTWIGTTALIAVGYILFAAMGAGWFAARRPALAGALSVFAGAAIFGVVTFVSYYGPAAIGPATFDLVLWELRALIAVIPYAVAGAAAGAVGGWMRRRALRTSRARR